MRDDVAPIHLGLGAFLLTVFAPFGLGYFLSYFYRAVNAVVAPDLVRDLHELVLGRRALVELDEPLPVERPRRRPGAPEVAVVLFEDLADLGELIALAADHVEIIVGQPAPLFFDLAFDLLPVPLNAVPVHCELLFRG